MLGVGWDTVRLFLHVLAATVWVGGQITLAALLPTLRRLGADIPSAAARRFNQVARPAFAVLIATGVWNTIAESDHIKGRYQTTLDVKLEVVLLSGVAAAIHATTHNRVRVAVFRRTHRGERAGRAIPGDHAGGLTAGRALLAANRAGTGHRSDMAVWGRSEPGARRR
jgi:putative copper export protein